MDANRGVLYDAGGGVMGGYFFGNPPHAGTYLKDIHIGLQNFLNSRYSISGSVFWKTGTRGSSFAAGTDPTGAPAVVHPNEVSAFGEITSEIDTNRTLLLCFKHWNLNLAAVPPLPPSGTNSESTFGGTYYTWGATPTPPYTNAEDEVWTNIDNGLALGHAVTAVGYIRAGDTNDVGPQLGLGPTDWVIVHDNWFSTPRNVIIPYGSPLPPTNGTWVAAWTANTTARPWPTAIKFVKGLVPDWNQPYQYNAQSPNGGPGPDPQAGVINQWNAWCAPSSAANLAGHWTDYHSAPLADSTPFAGSTVVWAAGPSWQDYLADGFARPAPQVIPGPLPVPTTDIGWYLDANRGVLYDPPGVGTMGGFFFGNPNHPGTFLKDIHIGLQLFMNNRYTVGTGVWLTGTEGKAFAAGVNSLGAPAQIHTNAVSAFGEVTFEVGKNRTLLLSYLHWNIVPVPVPDLPPQGTNTESDLGGAYYQFASGPGTTNAEDEDWNLLTNDLALGHVVTAVGYIPAGDVLDPGVNIGLGPTDWVIVHDNWASTVRNVIIPYDFLKNWVANTIAYADTNFLQLISIALAGGTNAVISLTGIPGYQHDLRSNTNLLTTNAWVTAVSNAPFAPGTMQITNVVPAGDPQRFYRIRASN
jgi:hypothetical protein